MSARKTIACIMIYPEDLYPQRVLDGLQTKCEAYGYNLAVFTPLVNANLYYQEYLNAEKNIFNLPDFKKFDAVVILTVPMIVGDNDSLPKEIVKKIKNQADIPIISLDYQLDDCLSVFTDDTNAFYNITNHIIESHNCKKIYMLTGFENSPISEQRCQGYRSAMSEHGFLNDDYIFYGDFWYTSGEQLADRIISGEIEKPEAIVCAGDHPAIGLTSRLNQGGIKVPDDIIVTGYDATPEAVTSDISITSYIPDISFMAMKAIDKIKSIIEPEREVINCCADFNSGLMIGESCGCKVDYLLHKKLMRATSYNRNRNYNDTNSRNIDNMSTITENYMLESLSRSETPLECLKLIYSYTYLIEPYDDFYLCLKTNWLDTEVVLTEGYPNTMRCVLHSKPPEYGFDDCLIHCRNEDRDNFSTELMLPALREEKDEPYIYYFVPCHFYENTLGYAVYCCNMEKRAKLTLTFQMWFRNVNTSLEMVRTRNKLIASSLIDSMTKLHNRRGMTMRINDLLRVHEAGDKLLTIVIDMDGLKNINDTYGHNEGDEAIITVASVVRIMTEYGESSCRAGGDEFYILGVGDYTDKQIEKRINRFYELLDEENKKSLKPYKVTASLGYNIIPINGDTNISEAIAAADTKMYISKSERKKGNCQ